MTVQLLRAGALVASVAIVVVYLLTPVLNGVLDEQSLEPNLLPNSAAVATGVAVAQVNAQPAAIDIESTSAAIQPADQRIPPPVGDNITPKLGGQPGAGMTILDERFTSNAQNWPSSADGTAQWSNGSYQVIPRTAGQFVAIGATIAQGLQDTTVSATFHKLGGPPGGGYGVMLRDQATMAQNGTAQTGHYYVLEAGDKGEIGIWRRDGDYWVDLLSWQHSDAVRTGTAVNQVTAQASGNRLSLIVNGAEVASRTDSTYAAGGAGIFVGGDGNVVAVDSFTIETP